MKKIKVMTVFGTRPEAVKMAPLVDELCGRSEFDCLVCVTAQHRQMLDQTLEIFGIKPDFDLNIMTAGQTPASVTSKALELLYKVFAENKPDIVLVHGDTATTFAAALAAFYNKIKVGHVEAGLRTYNKYFPFPEEMNRKMTGAIADIHFAPTVSNAENLRRENIEKSVYITGNTVIDALKMTVNPDYKFKEKSLSVIDFSKNKVILLTAHRRENLGKPLENILNAVKRISAAHKEIKIIYPVHPNPAVHDTAYAVLSGIDNVVLTSPLDIDDMHNLMSRCFMVMTDSGGLQEEAPSLGKPVLVLRGETERPEAVSAGTVKLAGVDENNIFNMAIQLIENENEYKKMANAVNPYGDGRASRRIADAVLFEFGQADMPPENFR